MEDKLYEEFFDPTDAYKKEPRAFCYEVSSQLIEKAKNISSLSWYENQLTIQGILLLLFTWNFASPITKKLNFKSIGDLIKQTKGSLILLEKYNIKNADNNAWELIKVVFDQFCFTLGQTGASKALSLLNPGLFVMWDTQIRRRLNKEIFKGIGVGKTGEAYITFLMGIQKIINDFNFEEKLPPDCVLAKKIDEYHFVRIVMDGGGKHTDNGIKLMLPDNIKGRSIYEKIIPTVCNLKNMLQKLVAVHGDVYLLKPWEQRSYSAYLIERIKPEILTSRQGNWKEIVRNHILLSNPMEFGASCIDIYLVAYVNSHYGTGKQSFFKFVKEKGISKADNSAQAIWQVGKGDGVFLDLLNRDGTVKDLDFFRSWISDQSH